MTDDRHPPSRPTLSLKASRKPVPAPETKPAAVAAAKKPVAASRPAKQKKQKAVAAAKKPVAQKQVKPPHKPPFQPRTSDGDAKRLMDWLGQQSVVWQDNLPLNIGTINEVYALLEAHGMQGAWSRRTTRKAMQWHTGVTPYLRNLQSHPHRYSLAGEISGEVEAAHRDSASAKLEERERERNERRERKRNGEKNKAK